VNERIRELIEQATKVTEPDDPDYRYEWFDKEKFAALVAAEEREACAKVCEQYDDDGGAGETWGPRFADAIRARGGE